MGERRNGFRVMYLGCYGLSLCFGMDLRCRVLDLLEAP